MAGSDLVWPLDEQRLSFRRLDPGVLKDPEDNSWREDKLELEIDSSVEVGSDAERWPEDSHENQPLAERSFE